MKVPKGFDAEKLQRRLRFLYGYCKDIQELGACGKCFPALDSTVAATLVTHIIL